MTIHDSSQLFFGYTFQDILAAQQGRSLQHTGAPIRKCQAESAVVAPVIKDVLADLLLRPIKAWWLFQGKEYLSEGKIILVQSVFGRDKLRITVEMADGNHQRCYTNDERWRIEIGGRPPEAQ